jgi:anti-anti-sigma factor
MSQDRSWADAGLRCVVEHDGAAAVVHASGELDMATLEALRRPLAELGPPDGRPVVIDLTGVSFMDSTGLRLLIAECARAHEGSLRIDVGAASAVHRLLELTGTLEQLPVRIVASR